MADAEQLVVTTMLERIKQREVKGYHNVPETDAKLRDQWLAQMKRDPQDGKYPKYFYLCGIHFEDDYFERDLKYELTGSKRNFKLKANAAPSIIWVFGGEKETYVI